MKSCLVIGFVVLGLCQLATAEVGQCKTFANSIINSSAIVGDWYEVLRTGDGFECVMISTELDSDNSTITFSVSANIVGEKEKLNITGRLIPFNFGAFEVYTFGDIGNNFTINIFGTDYYSYTIVSYCKNINTTEYEENVWILSRAPTVSESALTLIENSISKFWNITDFITVKQGETCNSGHRELLNILLFLATIFIAIFIK